MKNLIRTTRPMKSLSITGRVAAAFLAVATTVTLFSSVISISEPQRSVLMAQIRHADMLAAAHTMVQVAMAPANAGK